MIQIMKSFLFILSFSAASVLYAQIEVSIPDTTANVGDEVTIPVNTANVDLSDQVIAIEAEIHFDSNVLRPIEISRKGTLIDNDDWFFYSNPNYANGVMKFGGGSTGNYLNGSGPIAFLKFEVIGNPGDTSPLSLANFSYNGSDPPAERTQDGTLTVNYSTIEIQTNPGGKQFNFDGDTYTAPQSFKVSPNSSHSVNVPDPQTDGADTRFIWSSWSDGGAESHSVTAPAANNSMMLTASFNKQFHLSTSVSPSGGGSISKSPDANWFNDGASVTLTATASDKYDFSNWSGTKNTSANPLTITMNQAHTITANFTPWPHITVTTQPDGRAITVDGTSYTAPQTFQWQPGTTHSVGVSSPQEVSGDTRYVYSHWSDGEAQTHDITVPSSDQTYTATFDTQYKLTISSDPTDGGTVSASPSDTWQDENAEVTLTATANADFQFVGWDGDLGGSQNPATLTMDAPKNVIGKFGETATITIHTNPEGLEVWVDDATQLHTAPYSFTALTNTKHTIGTPSPQNETSTSRMVWRSWDDGGGQSHEITVNKSKTSYTATFVQQFKLNTDVSPAGAGTVNASPSGPWYDDGTNVDLTATATGSYDFEKWTGNASGTSVSVSITMDASKSVTANFKAWPHITVTTNPAGLGITVDGNPGTAPQIFQWKPGSNHTIAVDSPQQDGAAKRYVYQSWSDGKAQEHSITVPDADQTYTASFKIQYKLSTSVVPAEGGRIDIDKPGPWYDAGEEVTLTAVPANQYDFEKWSGDASGTTITAKVTMNSGKQVTANFKHWPQITVTTNPTGLQITVDGTPATAPQTFTWQPGTSHTIEAVAEQNDGTTKKYVWTAWSDGGTRSHTMQTPQTDATFTATYKTQFYVQTQASPAAGGTVSPASGWVDANTQLSFKATSTNGYGFLNWSGSWEGDENPKTVRVNSAIDITANFSQYRQITLHTNPEGLKVKADGNEATAPVTVNWLIGTTHSVDVNSPQNGGSGVRYVWQSWSDGGGQHHSVQVTAELNSITADFSKEYYVTVHINPQGAGTVSPGSGWYAENSRVTFTEQANEGYEFLQWSSDASGSSSSVQVVVDRAKTITANYNEWYVVTVRAEKTSATQTVLQIIVDGKTYVSPHTFSAQPNSVHTIEAAETQTPEGQGRRYQYIDWSDRGARSHQITVSANNMEFVAHYALQFRLTQTVDPEGTGSIQTGEEGEWIAAWKTVQVEALAENGYVFKEWQGDLQGKQNPTSIYMDGPKSIQANFEVAKTPISFRTSPPGLKINVDGTEYQTPVSFNWSVGESHGFEAIAPQKDGDNIRYQFNHWNNQGAQNQKITVGSNPETFQAYYDTYYNVTATSPQGKVVGAGWYKAGSTATISVDSTVEVNTQERYLFSGWVGNLTSTNAHFPFKVEQPVQERAEFQHQFKITTDVSPSHSGTVGITPSQDWYAEGMEVILRASEASGYQFLNWSGTVSGNQNPLTLNINAPITARANFQKRMLPPVISSFGINKYAVANTDTITLQFAVENGQAVTPEIQWFRNGVIDTLLANKIHILPSDVKLGDVLYAVFRVSNGTYFSRWHRTPFCPVLPVQPPETKLFRLSGKDTTVAAGGDSAHLLIHFYNSGQNAGRFTVVEEDTLEKFITINYLKKSSKFYFNNTLDGYLFISGNLGNYTWSLSVQYSDEQLQRAGLQKENSLKIGWSDNLGSNWHYLSDITIDTLNNLIQTGSMTHFSLWALGEKPFSKFYPVELSSFSAEVSKEGKVILSWKTKTETNNLGFEVQRKAKQSGFFEKIGFVKGAGTSVLPRVYHFEDVPQKPGLFSYRLKQVDLNGAMHVTQEINVSVQVPISSLLLRNYPNPFNSNTTIQFFAPKNYENKDATVTIYDIVGKEIISFEFPRIHSGIHEIKWDGKDVQNRMVPSGLFFYELKIGKMRKIQKMILLK